MTRPVRLKAAQHEKIWGSMNLEPWFPRSDKKIGEVWFTAESAIPVLVKFLFTSDKLSVQVHPAGALGKTEMWYILRAEPGAQIALGFRKRLSRERMREAAQSGEIESLLRCEGADVLAQFASMSRRARAATFLGTCRISSPENLVHIENAVPVQIIAVDAQIVGA